MNKLFYSTIFTTAITTIIFIFTGCQTRNEKSPSQTITPSLTETDVAVSPSEQNLLEPSPTSERLKPGTKNVQNANTHFSKYNKIFRFSAVIPQGMQVTYQAENISINIYDPEHNAPKIIDQSQIFIRYFEASQFLTLNTVNILDRQETLFNGHKAVMYEIEKKKNVNNFKNQPLWRNQKHKLIDIRLSENNPTLFYVFSYNPKIPKEIFEEFINSLIFDNDLQSIISPIDDALLRATKKPFGIKITPETSPIQPERFKGYHTGTDFEVLPEEINSEISISAICGGELLQKKTATGYGGVMVQKCLFENQPVTVIYGHLKYSSIKKEVNDYMVPGETIGVLGAHEGSETDGERKHLHLGIHKGSAIDIRGYVSNQSELMSWLDPMTHLKKNNM